MRFSIVIPTYQRRYLVVRTIGALKRQVLRDFEVIVVDDGSTDGTAAAIGALEVPFPLRVIEQRHLGAAAARNAGAAAADGELLLFLDDDMEADPQLLVEHDRTHGSGAELVLGDIPLHPASPRTELAAATGRWADRRRKRLSIRGTPVGLPDLLSGQLSISAAGFRRVGGFDVSYTRGGLVPGADRDFGYRARTAGLRVVFNPAAISYQYYDVRPSDYTRRSRDAARGDQVLRARYPEAADELWSPRFDTRIARLMLTPLVVAPRALSAPIRWLAIGLFSQRSPGDGVLRFFFAVQTMERLRGAREARRALERRLAVVLAFHSTSDAGADRPTAWNVPRARLGEQLDRLLNRGWQFIGADELLRARAGRYTLPRRAVLVTFDDGYLDLLETATSILAPRQVPAVVFVVSERVGGSNEWRRRGMPRLPLLDAEGLRLLMDHGFAIGAHGATHRSLVGLTRPELDQEVERPRRRLAELGLPTPEVFAYPYGEFDTEAVDAVRAARYAAAFTVDSGIVTEGADGYTLPRVEVLAEDSAWKLNLKVATAGWREPWRTRLLRLTAVRTRP